MGGGRSGTTTTTAYNLPDVVADPFAKEYLQRSYEIATDPGYAPFFAAYVNNYLPDDADPTYAGFQDIDGHYAEKDGIEALAARKNGNATINKGKVFIKDVLDGNYLDAIDAEFVEMQGDVTGKPTATFTNDVMPKLGASLYLVGDLSGENLANTLSSTLAIRYSDRAVAAIKQVNYQTERERQHAMARLAIEYAEEPIKDAEASHRAGLRYRIWLHGKYTADYELWQDLQTSQLRRTEVLGNAIRSLVGSQKTRTEPYHRPSPVAGMASGAISGGIAGGMAAGAQAGGMTGPQGAIIGAVAGAAIGYLGSQ